MNSIALTNIYNEGKTIYLFHRIGNQLRVMKEESFFPYIYEPSADGIYRGYFGSKYKRVTFKDPYLIPKQRSAHSAEADIIYTKRYMIDKINITKTNLRYVFFDIETQSKDLPEATIAPDPITCITCYDNYTDKYTTFWTLDYNAEEEMIEAFIKYIKETQPDLMLAWNGVEFDYMYLITRFPDLAQKISSIDKVVKRTGFPAGIAIVDYMEWVKKVYRFKRNSLEYVYCDVFKLPYMPHKYGFDKVTNEIKEKNQADVRKMVELEKKLRLIPYFDEKRRLSKALWEDLTMYSVLVDGYILQNAKETGFILPSRPSEAEKLAREEDEITGGYVYAKPGFHENVKLFDVSGTYPNLIITFNLDPMNKRKEASANTTAINGIHIEQNSRAIVPTVCNRLVASRKEIQKQLETVIGEEAELLKKKDEAHKSLNNTVYGVLLFKSSRLYDRDIASSITFLARFLIRYTKWALRQRGYEVVGSDTDSIFIKTDADYANIQKQINEEIIPTWLKRFNKTESTLKFKYEGTFTNLFILTKKHYAGNFVTASGEEKVIKKGIEALRSDSSKFQERFQEELLNKILNKESKDEIMTWVEINKAKMLAMPLTEIAFPVKLSKTVEAYKTEGIHVRALRYAQALHPEWQVRIGQDYFYTYIVPEKVEVKTSKMGNEVKKEIDVMAFDEFTKIDFKVDYERLIERNITMKCDAIYEAMGWKQVEIKVKKEKVVKEVKVKQNRELAKKELMTTSEVEEKSTQDIKTRKKESSAVDNLPLPVLPKEIKEETIKLNHSFKTQAEITERTIMVAEAFGLGIDDEKSFTIYDNAEVKIKTGDVIYITGDSGSGKSWLLQNVFAKMPNAISINDLKIDENEVVVEGVGKDLSDALMKLNVAGLGDAFLYLRKYCQLSDGQKYRYRIAKFIDNEDKDIWICDEFCATLDRVTAKVVAYNIQKIARKLNKTLVVATTHTDLLNEIRPNVHILKGYESEVNIDYYKTQDWAEKKLEFYNDMKVEVGERKDYDTIKKFHYRQAALGAVKKIYKCTYKDELVGAIVITYPHLALKGRNIFMSGKYNKMTKENCDAINRDFECIARIVVTPKYRGIGLSYYFLKEYFKLTDIKYTETLAVMAGYNPFFVKAGMTRIDVDVDERREKMIAVLTTYGFNTDLLASSRYFNSVYDKLSDVQKEQVKNIVINILDKYKGQIVTLQKTDWKSNWKDYVKHIARANTIYLIKQLKDEKLS